MSVIFYEDFAGTSAFSGTTPEVNIASGLTWTASGTQPATLANANGWLGYTPVAAADTAAGVLILGNTTTTRSLAARASVIGYIRPVASSSDASFSFGFYLADSATATQTYFGISQAGGVWTMTCGLNGATGATASQVLAGLSLTPGVEYPIVFEFANGLQRMTAFGVTISATGTLSANALSGGVSGVQIAITQKLQFRMENAVNGGFFAKSAPTMQSAAAGTQSSYAVIAMPAPTLEATGSGLPSTAELTMPRAAAFGYFGGNGSASMPRALVSGLGRSSANENNASLTAPTPYSLGYGGASVAAKLPTPLVAIAATFSNNGQLAVVMPAAKVSASGTSANTGRGAASMSLPKIVGYGGALASIKIARKFTVSSSATAGAVGRVAAVLPLFEVAASGAAVNTGRANILSPKPYLVNGGIAYALSPIAQVSAIGSAVVTVTYEAYALNLKHNAETIDELTRYTNFPFDRIVRYQNSYYGMNSTGLFLLEGTTDFAEPTPTPISWSWKTTMTDFGTTQLQTVRWAYFGGRMAPAAQIAIHFGDTASESYAYNTPRDTSAQNYRQEFGRGIKSRYYAFSGQGSGELSLDSINFIIAKLARKV